MVTDALDWLTSHARVLNLLTTVAVLLFSIVPFIRRPILLQNHPQAWHAFGFWILQWITLLLLYVFFPVLTSPTRLPFLLLLVDVQSILALGFFRAFLDGRAYRPLPVWLGLLVIFGIYAGLDLGIGSLVVGDPPGSERRLWWVAGSEMLSAASLVLLGGVFVVRFGKVAFWMVIATALYGFLQRPVYSSTFVYMIADQRPFLALAVWKLVVGSLFYLYFLAPIESYEPAVRLPSVGKPTRDYLEKWQARVLAAIGALFALVLADLIGRLR